MTQVLDHDAMRNDALRVEHEYERAGVLQYLAAWDVHRAVVFGRCEPKTGKAAFGRLVDDVMNREPYRSARRVFWIVDNGSSHRGERAADELRARHPRIVIVHTPTYASWLNQIEIYFSIIQRKVLKPNDYTSLEELADAIHAFGRRYSALGKLFAWCFTRQDLERRLREPLLQPEAFTLLAVMPLRSWEKLHHESLHGCTGSRPRESTCGRPASDRPGQRHPP